MAFKLISVENIDGHNKFYRTPGGTQAVNAVKTLINRMGKEQAVKLFRSSFGMNSIKLFLILYDKKWEEGLENKKVFFSPGELGRLTLSISRSIEGMAAFEKLNDAGLLIYEDDGNIHMPPVLARNFYGYLLELYDIIKVKMFKRRKKI